MPISPRSGARGLERMPLPHLKHYNVLKWERRFTLGVNYVWNTDYLKKCFKWKFNLQPSSASLTSKKRTSTKCKNVNVCVVFPKNAQNMKQQWNHHYTLYTISHMFVYMLCLRTEDEKAVNTIPVRGVCQTVTGEYGFHFFSYKLLEVLKIVWYPLPRCVKFSLKWCGILLKILWNFLLKLSKIL